ncbi:MAG: hypothetical protein GWM92_08295, partial [Gemmatimonadetes bacterium]|nr:hypothetical protein [Gemmatimonadota bacterium]NIR78642.1 hypothetical protein [Gemmatimonadota bacterium]NIT87261.1 hypothetical protein [Gemmatimonadota bacterium]NIU31105.1 hypothetical protein [Gemmatimonadota bacterium]NIU35839.1 hypothetical protein [Gemmatimonadota bacterium]
DASDATNGLAFLFPRNWIMIGAPPPTDGVALAFFDDWIELVVVHELAHIFHLDRTGALGSVFRKVLGRVPSPWPLFPGIGTPRWVREGLATYYESALTGAGRTHGTFHDMVVRTAAAEGAFEELDEVSGDSPVWPDGTRPYAYGSLFFESLLERHGEERMDRFADAVADQWIPYRLNSAAEDAFGTDFGDAWQRWRAEQEDRVRALRDSLSLRAPITEPEALTTAGRYAMGPRVGSDGRLAYARSDGTSDAQVALLEPGGGRTTKLTRSNGIADLSWAPDGSVVFSQLEFTDPYRVRSDLYRVGPDGGAERLTRGARLDQPDVARDGSALVAVQQARGTNRLVVLDADGEGLRPLTALDPDVHWAYPRFSPDGRWIAVSRWRTRHSFDVVILDRRGRLRHRVTRDRAVDLAPAWSPDGRWLLWSSDRTGIWNVLAVPVDSGTARPGAAVQLTNVITGAAFPSVSPDGRWLYFSGYHAHGWQVERVPFRPEKGFEPFPLDPRFRDGGGGGTSMRAAEDAPLARRLRPDSVPGRIRSYSPFPTLWPHFWQPAFTSSQSSLVVEDGTVTGRTDVVGSGVGFFTASRDAIGRHGYSVQATVTPKGGRLQGFGAYSYAGLGNPVVGASAAQSYDVASSSLVGRADDGSEEILFLTERERTFTLFSNFVRRRFRSVSSVEVAGSYIRERLELLERSLERSTRFRLLRPTRQFLQGRVTLFGDNTRRHPFSISREDGLGATLQLRAREEIALPDSLSGVAGGDRSFQDAIARLRAFKSVPLPGFANHVLALRLIGGVGRGPGADGFHYDVGGVTGSAEPITGLELFGGGSVLFPVRGFAEGERSGRYAWSASAEYRVPLVLAHEGAGLLPLFLDRISGSLFLDAGNAWGPELGLESRRFQNPRLDPLVSVGGEVTAITIPFFTSSLVLRTGLALPLQGGKGVDWYLRLGTAF